MRVEEEIRRKLSEVFQPTSLDVLDESEQHRGHAGYQDGGQSHFRVVIAAEKFSDMSRLERHRAIHAALGPELIGCIHALALQIEA